MDMPNFEIIQWVLHLHSLKLTLPSQKGTGRPTIHFEVLYILDSGRVSQQKIRFREGIPTKSERLEDKVP